MPSLIGQILQGATALAQGFHVTFRHLFRPTVTENCPDEPPHVAKRPRGRHFLERDKQGLEKCGGCLMCMAACPANCISIEVADNPAAHRISAGKRYAAVFTINYNRCTFCGDCVEACPNYAISQSRDFELASHNVTDLIYRKEQLLRPQRQVASDQLVEAVAKPVLTDCQVPPCGIAARTTRVDFTALPSRALKPVRNSHGNGIRWGISLSTGYFHSLQSRALFRKLISFSIITLCYKLVQKLPKASPVSGRGKFHLIEPSVGLTYWALVTAVFQED